jgi:hypothetical protein
MKAPAITGGTIASRWSEVRNAARNLDADAFVQCLRRADAVADEIAGNLDAFKEHWKALLNYRFERLQFAQGLEHLRQAASVGLIDTRLLPLLDDISAFTLQHAETLNQSRAALENPQNEQRFDFQVTGWMRMFNPLDTTRLDARALWLSTVQEALSIAAQRGLSILLVPDYCAQLLGRRARRVLSWHTKGKAGGVIHFKPADLPGYAVMDAGGYSGWSSLASQSLAEIELPALAEALSFFQFHKSEVLSGNLSKYCQKANDGGGDLPEDFVFVALQVASDRTQKCAYLPMLEMLAVVVERFRGSGTQVVVKRHPQCASPKVASVLQSLAAAGEIQLSDLSIHILTAKCRAVITVNSGVGSEAIIHLKPVYTFGASDYAAIAHSVHDATQFDRLTRPVRTAAAPEDMIRFLQYYRNQYLVRITDRQRLRAALEKRVFGLKK